MNRRLTAACAALFAMTAASASAQTQPAGSQPSLSSAPTRAWVVVGGASTSSLSSCEDCVEDPATYRHTGSVMANVGASINRRADVGAEMLFVTSSSTDTDRIRVNFFLGSVQFRPWQSSGFFVKAGMGMAFVRNWVLADGADTGVRSKALAVGLGAGWEWRVTRHVGAQILGAQHVAALGDLEVARGTVENVMGNFWSVGAAIVVR